MGGWGSGRQGGRPTADSSLFVEIGWMLRNGKAEEGVCRRGELSWTRRGETSGRIGYVAHMDVPGEELLELIYTNTRNGQTRKEHQRVMLEYTVPNFGGKRWWMICPVSNIRVGKLFLPPGGDIFAGREAWRLNYQSQRDAARDRPFERLFRLQKKLGCYQGWEAGLWRPKGMWHRTHERHLERYWELDAECAREMELMASRLIRR